MNPKIFKILGWVATFTAYSCCNKLHFMGKLRFFSKEKRLAYCGGKSSRCSFRCYSCGYSSITDDFQI